MAQGIYYLEASDGTIVELDATTNINETYSSTITSNPVDSGRTLTDHYYHNPTTVRFEGIITNVYATDFTVETLNVGDKDPTLFRQKVRNVLESKEPLTVFLFDIQLKNYLITSLSYDTDATIFGGYKVNMSLQQVELVDSSETVVVQLPPPDMKDPTSDLESGGSSNTVEDPASIDNNTALDKIGNILNGLGS